MNKYVVAVCCFFAVFLIGAGLPSQLLAINDFQTQPSTDSFLVTTNVSSINSTVQLTKNVYNADTSTGFAVLSNTTLETPVVASYDDTTRALNLTGLSTNLTRTVTVNYRSAGLSNYTGALQASWFIPVILVTMLIAIALAVGVSLFIK